MGINSLIKGIKQSVVAATVVVLGLYGGKAQAQAYPANFYSFSASQGTYSYLNGGTAMPTTFIVDTKLSDRFPIGFAFNFCGINYDSLAASSDGYITFGKGTNAAGNSTTSLTNIGPALMPLWDDLKGNPAAPFNSSSSYLLTGTAPNRVFTFEWKNWMWNWGATLAPTISFQVKLYEGTNIVEFVYNPETGTINNPSASIGIGATPTDYISLDTTSNTTTVSNSSFNTNIKTKPASGQIFRFTPPPVCAGAPVASNVVGPNQSCYRETVNLTLDQPYLIPQISYQWQSSPDSLTWTNITKDTTLNYYKGENRATQYYRCKIKCRATADSIYTPGHKITLSSITVPYFESFESLSAANTLPGCWKGTNMGSKIYTTATATPLNNRYPRTGSYFGYFGTSVKDTLFAPLVELQAGKTYDFSYWKKTHTANVYDSLSILVQKLGTTQWQVLQADTGLNILTVDYKQVNGQFTPTQAGQYLFAIYAKSKNTTAGFISFDDIKIAEAVPCNGVFATNSVTGPNPACIGAPFILTIQNLYNNTGLVYRWQSSVDSSSWTDITGAVSEVLTAAAINSKTYFRFIAKCVASGDSVVLPYAVNVRYAQPVTLPYFQDFESAWMSSSCGTNDIPDASWMGLPYTGNNAWRRDNDTLSAAWNSAASGGYQPRGANGSSRSARFHSQYTLSGIMGSLDLYAKFNAGSYKVIRYDYININGSDSLFVEVSLDKGQSWNLLDKRGISATWSSKTLFTQLAADTAIVRFRAKSDYGSTDIGLDNVSIFETNCLPVTSFDLGNIYSDSVNLKWGCGGCGGATFKLEFGPTGFTPGTGTFINGIMDSTYTIPATAGLNIGTYYDAYVYKDCSAANPGDPLSPASSVRTFALKPYNDTCTGAIAITPATSAFCSGGITGTTVGATNSPGNTSCTTPDDDVWYSFVATSPVHTVSISNVGSVKGTSKDMYHQVLSSACTTFTSVLCSDADTSIVKGLTVGNTYWVRVWTKDAGVADTFKLCVGTVPVAVNDSCSTATTLVAGSTAQCVDQKMGITTGAGSTPGLAACLGTADDDVWYKFTATAITHRIDIRNVRAVAGTTDMVHQVFSGNCNALANVKCSDPDSSLISGLTIGQDYYIRVWTKDATAADTFNICVTGVAQPANDSCLNAQVLPVGTNWWDQGGTPGSTFCANTTPVFAACAAGAEDDVWYKFTAPNTTVKVKLNAVGSQFGGSTDMYHQLYTGNCSALMGMQCNDPDSSVSYSLTVGQDYFIRVWTKTVGDAADSFLITVNSLPSPANDECGNAAAISCGNTLFGNTNAAANDNATTFGCAFTPTQTAPGVWYKFTGTGDSVVFSTCHDTTRFDTRINIFKGVCGTFTCVADNDNNAACTGNNKSSLVGFVTEAGASYYVLVHGVAQTGMFALNMTCMPCVKPTVNLGPDTVMCSSGSLMTLTAAGNGDTYLWNTNATTKNLVIDAPGQYTVTAYSRSGCRNYDTIRVTASPSPTIWAGNDTTVCVGLQARLTATLSAGANIRWSTGETTPVIDVDHAGTYIATATNIYGCTTRDTVEVMYENNPVVNMGADVTECPGVPVVLNAGFPGYVYNWSNGGTNQTTAVLNAGTYWVEVLNSKGCRASDTIVVTHKPLPAAGFDYEANGTVVNFTDTSKNVINRTWYFGDQTPSSNAATLTHMYVQYGTYKVTLVVQNTCGSDTTSITLGLYPTGINEVDKGQGIALYPNPAKTTTVLQNKAGLDIRRIVLIDAAGKQVLAMDKTGTAREVNLDVSPLPGGLYLVQVFTADGVITRRLELIK